VICNTPFDKEEILLRIVEKIEQNIWSWNENPGLFRLEYTNTLFKQGIPMPFEDLKQHRFMGIIQGVSNIGKLRILLENDTVSDFDIKEIQMLY
jgi:BirA family biotin operon repressor/biotin-[acetyl-CoA-carboxylase] ligase